MHTQTGRLNAKKARRLENWQGWCVCAQMVVVVVWGGGEGLLEARGETTTSMTHLSLPPDKIDSRTSLFTKSMSY